MKKLALALVCFASLAFFASCTPEGDPTIYVLNEDGYVKNGDIVDVNTEFNFGFVMASSIETGKELASLILKYDDNSFDTIALTGKDYTYTGTLMYEMRRDEIIGTKTIQAIVTDAAGKTATASITLSINQPAEPLEANPFRWYRLGSGNNVIEEGLEEFGLYWEKNIKATHAQIKPLEGVTLYKFDAEKWAATTTDVEKAALFAAAQETGLSIAVYNNVSTSAGDTYNDVIGTVMADGTCHLINVLKCEIGDFQPQGYPITITGNAK